MNDSRIHILGIAPYEGMKTVMEQAAENNPNIQLDVAIGDMEEGVAIVQSAPKDYYDCILSRGGTADLIRQVVNIPVIDVPPSVYDVLRSIKLAEHYDGKCAIVGFPSITEPAHTLCDLLRYQIRIVTVHSRQSVMPTLLQLQKEGVRMVISDMIAHTYARQIGMDAFLIASGAEGIRAALDQAVSFSTSVRQMRQENRILRSIYQGESAIILLDNRGTVRYAKPGEPSNELVAALRSRLKEVRQDKPLSFYWKNHATLYGITAQSLQILDTDCVVFYCQPGQIPLRGSKLGLRSYGQVECEHLFMNSFYSISGAMGETENTVAALALSRQPVLITGEEGTGKEQIARALYLRSRSTNMPFLVCNCKILTDKTWDFLINHPNSPINGTRSTFYFQYLESLSEARLTQLQAVILETGLAKRQRLIFSCTCLDGAPLPEGIRQFTLALGCLTLRLPSLRSRADEIHSLASLYLNSLNQELGKQITGFDPSAIEQLRRYRWPNNYTQFKQVLHELAVLCDSSYIRSSLVADLLAKESTLSVPSLTDGPALPTEGTLEEITRRIIRQTVAAHNGNQTAAARQLGIGRTTLWRHLGHSGTSNDRQ